MLPQTAAEAAIFKKHGLKSKALKRKTQSVCRRIFLLNSAKSQTEGPSLCLAFSLSFCATFFREKGKGDRLPAAPSVLWVIIKIK